MTGAAAALALGGAQFGLDYGISNRRGRIPFSEVERILTRAAEAGVWTIDTAPAYGDSEDVVGRILGDDPRWRVITKTADLSGLEDAARCLSDGLSRSLERLQRSSIDTLLFHRVTDLDRNDAEELLEAAEELKRVGLTRRLGVSVYESADLDVVLRRGSWDVVQVPLSIVDQRLIKSGHLARLARAGIEVHVRSVFLQGLLLCPPEDLPDFAAPFASALSRLRERSRGLGISPLELCLASVRRLPEVSLCLIGLSGLGDLEQALAARLPDLPDLADLALDQPDLVDPRRWPRREAPSA
jgi:aryl-alcohol dehydrogenase-like predicted oxidoreductase